MTEKCVDKNCPFHGGLKVRGNAMKATVVSDRMQNSVVVERAYLKKVKKYERYKRAKSRMTVHKPACLEVAVGDTVEIGETRKMSKTKAFVITKVLKEEGGK